MTLSRSFEMGHPAQAAHSSHMRQCRTGTHAPGDNAKRIRDRLPRRLQGLRIAMDLSNFHPGS